MSTTPERAPLPQLQETLLDAETLARLVSDIQNLTVVDEVLLKGGAAAMASSQPLSFAQAVEALQQGRALGLQVRYRYQGKRWWDTLLRAPGGVRLVRIEHDAAVQSGA
ncbi:MAG: hypothetical protein JXB05_13640 [Myxococcaceae bacterium]|nr:hypothetical protein [Myxococcaceae bacterium]